MNVIIIEDEQLSADHLATLLKRIDPVITITHRFESVKQSVEAFQSGVKADLLFADIHLADGSSFDIFHKITVEIPVIFTTAFDQYAIKAFRTNSIDYLLKPIDSSELKRSIEKFRNLNRQQHTQLIEQLLSNSFQSTKSYKNRFMVKLGENIISVKTDDIDHFISEDGVVLLATKLGKRYPVDYTLDQLDQLIDPDTFFRINRKVIVHIDAIQKISSFFNSRLKVTSTYISNDEAVVSRERVGDFKQWLNK
ncbi:MAG TPA: LytTR family DNA-binding domain-containing protein [Fluviicola sp.]|nr:LytTR family DNA-binding domain-containing protein [Fluviicola sp.]